MKYNDETFNTALMLIEHRITMGGYNFKPSGLQEPQRNDSHVFANEYLYTRNTSCLNLELLKQIIEKDRARD